MVIITQLSYPPESAPDMAKRFLEAPQLPNFLDRRGPYICSDREKGIVTFSVYELEKTFLSDGYDFLGSYMAGFFGVPGFKYDISLYYEIDEGLKLIGM